MHQLIDKKKKILIYLIFLFILSTTSGKFNDNQNTFSSTISKINIEGLSKANNSKILNELNDLFYKNIFLIKKKEIKKTVSKYNIIEEYNVKKVYPKTIIINIKPTKLIARISNDDQLLIGANGKLITSKDNKMVLPYLFGEFNSKEFLAFKKKIKQSNFNFLKLKAIYFFPSHRWDILTQDDVLIKLPKNRFSESLSLAYKIIKNDNFKNKNLIDLRVNNHLIVK